MADKTPKKEVEVGVSGDFQTVYANEEKRTDEVTIEDIRKMRLNDGTVSAMYNLITLPIKAAAHYIKPSDGGQDEADFVEEALTRPSQYGGMTYSFDLFIADMLRSVEDAFRLYEKVWRVDDKGRLVYKKLAPRDAVTITLLRDEHGGFAGARQRTWNGSKYIDVTIPIDRCFLFTLGKEHSYLYGESPLRSAYIHFDRKQKLYYLQQLAAQASAIPPRKLKVPKSAMENEEKLALAEDAADNFGYQQRITLPEGWDLEEYKTNPMDLQKAIDHHDTLIARSMLMQFVALGSSETGSFALSKDQSDMFMTALVGIMRQIESHINSYIIPPLVDYNFNSGKYPEFKFEEIDNETRQLMSESFKTILGRDDVPEYVIRGIADEVAKQLGINIDEVAPKTQKLSESAADVRKRKAAGARIVAAKLDKAIDSAVEDATQELSRLKSETSKKLEALLKAQKYDELKSFELPSFARYRKLLENAMMDQYLYGKRSAADDGGVQAPKTPGTSKAYITEQARAIADKQEQDLLFLARNEVTKGLRTSSLAERQLGMLDVLAAMGAAWDNFVNKNAAAGVDIALTGSMNLGRTDGFANNDSIAVYEYSAILDNRTTPLCRSLDGTVLTPEQYRATTLIPPLHWKCRSVWVAYYKDDSFIPELKAPPASAVKSVNLSERVQQAIELSEETHAA